MTKGIGYLKAIEMMRREDVRLIRAHDSNGAAHYVVPGGYVEPSVADKIKNHPLVRGGKDGLFPNLDQTWRMIRDEQ